MKSYSTIIHLLYIQEQINNMIIQRLEYPDRPNEVAVWLTNDTLEEVDAGIAS